MFFYSTPGLFHVPKFIMAFDIPLKLISQVCSKVFTFREFFKAKIASS